MYSTLAYQGYGRGLPIDEVRRINEWAMGEIWPDLVVLLTVPPDVTADRLRGASSTASNRPATTSTGESSAASRRWPQPSPTRWVVVDAAESKDEVAAAIRGAVRERLGL